MSTITKEQAVQLARGAGMQEIRNFDFRGSYEAMTHPEKDGFDRVTSLVQAAYKLGRNAGLEDAKNVALAYPKCGEAIAEEIESLKGNTP
jgi:hypothetical protein